MGFNKIMNLILFAGVIAVGCTTDDTEEKSVPRPEWLTKMPLEKDYIYGIGADSELSKAKERAVIDAGKQFSSQVSSVFTEETIVENGETVTTVEAIDRLVTDQVVYGVKFVEQYSDSDGVNWILAKAPVSCMLDVTEGVLLSYSLNLEQDRKKLDDIVEKVELKVNEKLNRRVPWTPRVPDRSIRVDGKIDDWESIPVYYRGKTGDADQNGFDVDYIKGAMDSDKAYFLVVCADGKWSQNANFEINFDYSGNNLNNRGDLHTNISREWVNFWNASDNVENTNAFDPGVSKRFSGSVFEFSIPLKKYDDAGWFNIFYINVWLVNGSRNDPVDMNMPDYRATWIPEGSVPRY